MDIYNIFISRIPRSIEDFDPRKKRLITFLNPHSYTLAVQKAELFEAFDLIAPDGILVVAVLNFLKAVAFKITRFSCDMTSVVPYVFTIAIENKLSTYFFGTDASGIRQSVKVFRKSYPELRISGYRNGYFKSGRERHEAILNIVRLQPDIIFVGMGTILQETMVLDLRKAGYQGAVYTCGGFLHQTKHEINFYPQFIDKLNLRFFYRAFKEQGVLKRSIKTYPKFCYLMVCRLLRSSTATAKDAAKSFKIKEARRNMKVVATPDETLLDLNGDRLANLK
ncbi:WecB/TagA/CpsF family glycosyltransferase [Mucilaginibacter rubeus]|uniref:WecB/TagA/CpsF family glycosyltransferase n=1 Tax=Mucilaginibacter rubeus TaxID=2027860 RepID=A0AAE6JBD2_9SPHI|nr:MULTISPECIES: WecB/TagA/CpsF family glycosyltransferase [Mucilaginibacter]QEM02517.1 WecB/TagA/CpsF family glycosyltransferase [Mucilaginibacter rubeus]QEM15137.1 WecB/TagA/CpsF family glycosyltransferase [Mucilaginibacter gossypii]QTE42140.1 WecB/TagA/CpsF family glycosyltransferase [Mucilaginibacter rubeus]QTE48741.1 WecB/TagA/CpsF family glycosyltransferase [Mucilaginibacter rubeus]QTE53839.1 WecB/TagA/CpsF family glycosyltransferase [Mucilaginibacter rubeus]